MKNIHILPTDKPSRLSILNSGKLNFGAEIINSSNSKPQHIYITSDEEIKDAKWIIHNGKIHEVIKNKGLYISVKELSHIDIRADLCKKIILTTDQDLIKDGVQFIDDEFLEWFVKNPSCEEIEVENNYRVKSGTIQEHNEGKAGYEYYEYKIIIPKEESKQETLEEAADKSLQDEINYWYHKTGSLTSIDIVRRAYSLGITEGAKWQQERMYSEKDIRKAYSIGWVTRERFDDLSPDIVYPKGLDYEEKQDYAFNLWFEKFKKK